jgi:hypothetical protein
MAISALTKQAAKVTVFWCWSCLGGVLPALAVDLQPQDDEARPRRAPVIQAPKSDGDKANAAAEELQQ